MLKALLRKLFLVKEIKSKTGTLHFQRFRLLDIEDSLRIYVHRISASDEDAHMHDHPWDFRSLILRGSYTEESVAHVGQTPVTRTYTPGTVIEHEYSDFHQITLNTPVVWSLVVATGMRHPWGYLVNERWVPQDTYRDWKNGKLDWLGPFPG